jgi:hypothetical protein
MALSIFLPVGSPAGPRGDDVVVLDHLTRPVWRERALRTDQELAHAGVQVSRW